MTQEHARAFDSRERQESDAHHCEAEARAKDVEPVRGRGVICAAGGGAVAGGVCAVCHVGVLP